MSSFKVFVNYLMGSGVALLLSFLTTPVITRAISPVEYGKMSIMNLTITSITIVAILGLDQVFIRYFFKSNINKKILFVQCLCLPLCLNTFFAIVYCFFSDKINLFLVDKDNQRITLLFIINLYAVILNRFSYLIVRMFQDSKLYSQVQVIQKLFYVIGIFLFLFLWGGVFEVIIVANVISLLFSSLILIFPYLKKRHYDFNYKFKVLKIKSEYIRYGIPFALNTFLLWFFFSIDKISIKLYSTPLELGLYASASSLIVFMSLIKDTFNTFWAPVAIGRYEADSRQASMFFVSIFDRVFLAFSFLILFFILGKDIIVLILGSSYKGAANIFCILLLMPLCQVLMEITNQAFNFKNKPIYNVYLCILIAILNLILNYILVPYYGAKGAAIATAISFILMFVISTFFSERLYPVGYNVKKVFFFLLLFFFYSLYASFFHNFFIVGLFLFVCLICFYSHEMYSLFRVGIQRFFPKYLNILYFDSWNIGFSTQEIGDIVDKKSIEAVWVKHFYFDRFFADPFLFKRDDKFLYVLAEELKYWDNKGVIVLLKIRIKDGWLVKRKIVLSTNTHLSFPFGEINNNWFIPENYRSGETFKYYFDESFNVIKREKILSSGLIDAIFVRFNEKDYILSSSPKSPLDELNLYVKDGKEYKFSNLNPLKKSIHYSRNAGNIFKYKDFLVRPVQDSEKCYGNFVRLMKIKTISEDLIEEEEICSLRIQNPGIYAEAFHTFNVYEDVVLLDGYYRKYNVVLKLFILCVEKLRKRR